MKKVVREWMDQCLVCKGGTNHGLLMFRETADMGCTRMIQAIVVSAGQEQRRLVSGDSEKTGPVATRKLIYLTLGESGGRFLGPPLKPPQAPSPALAVQVF